MINSSNASPPTTTPAGQAFRTSAGDTKSILSQRDRKRDKVRRFFRRTKSEETAKTQPAIGQPARSAVSSQRVRAVNTEDRDHDDGVGSSRQKVSTSKNGTQCGTGIRKARLDILSENVCKPSADIQVPKIGMRINSTPQLALCSSLLFQIRAGSSHGGVHEGVQRQAEHDSLDSPIDRTQLDWIRTIKDDTVEQHHIRWLGTRMVEEFCKDAVKDSAAITEVVLLGPILDREHYRKLLNCFICEFGEAVILDVYLLQGLIQLVQCASEGYLVADDLVKILSILRVQLQNTHQQSTAHLYHLTLALSRLLDVMAEHKVQDVKRVEEHEPLSEILSGLRNSSDPYLMYQASYAYQALQYVPDDETPLQAVMRHSAGVAASLVKISGVIKLDLGSVLEGLKGFQEALSRTYDIAKSEYEGICSLKESGCGVFDSLKEGLGTGQKRL
ncbi:hypothetical protein BGZ68_002557, partial [Mortierella alpina]